MNLQVAAGSAVRPFAMSVVSSDGGKTWEATEGSGVPGDMLFTTQNDGWMGSGSPEDGLHVTHDGGKKWQEVTLLRPAKAAPEEADAIYHLPIFADKDHGFLAVEYEGANVHLVGLFSTRDGGRTWKSDKVVPLSLTTAKHPLFTVVNSQWRTLALQNHKLVLSSPLTSASLASASVDVNLSGVGDVTFLDSLHGWAIVGAEYGPTQLLSTSNAGASWNIITPLPIKGDFVEHPPHLKTGPLIWKRPTS